MNRRFEWGSGRSRNGSFRDGGSPRSRSAEPAPRSARGRVFASSRYAHPDEDVVDLVAVGLALRAIGQPHEVAGIDASDLAERPADVAAEIENAARRSSGRFTRAARPVAWRWWFPHRVVLRPGGSRADRLERSVDAHHLPRRRLAGEVRVMTTSKPSMGAGDRLVVGVPRYAKDRVGVAAAGARQGHTSAPPLERCRAAGTATDILGGTLPAYRRACWPLGGAVDSVDHGHRDGSHHDRRRNR